MTNLTLKIDGDLLRRARIKALEQGTSLSALVRRYLERFTQVDRRERALDRFLELAADSHAGSGPGGRTWSRDDLYDTV